jgi:hypothetical protein
MPSPEDAETILALTQGVDHVAQQAEAYWGVGRLPLLVDDDLRAKFARQALRWRNALEEAWDAKMLTRDQLDAVQKSSGAMQRAWQALDKAAKEAGAKALSPDVWEACLSDGSVACIVRTNAEAGHVIAEGRSHNVWTLEEIARAIELLPETIRGAKIAFPGATLQPARQRYHGKLDDPIPF